MNAKLTLIGEIPEFDKQKFVRVVGNFLDETARAMQADYYVTVKTWKHAVNFKIGKKKYSREIYTNDPPYFFVSGGTSVRYATMTPGFRAKSSPQMIRSRAGRGGVMYINKNRPRPGIVARQFPKTINQKWEKQYGRQWDRAVASEVFWTGK